MPIIGTIASSIQSGFASTYEVISSVSLSASANSYTFSSIPSTYTHLAIRGSIRSTDNVLSWDDWYFRFNADSGTNYSGRLLWATGTTVNTQYDAGSPTDSMRLRPPMSVTASPNNNAWDNWECWIFNYASTSKWKTAISHDSCVYFDTPSAVGIWQNGVVWKSNSAVTSIYLQSFALGSGRQLASGCVITLYGIKTK
jgi:hypothetical protein